MSVALSGEVKDLIAFSGLDLKLKGAGKNLSELSHSLVSSCLKREHLRFPTQQFEVLIGAARVLGETYDMIMAEVLESEDFELSAKIAANSTTN